LAGSFDADVIVVGGSTAGLGAATRLADAGRSVTVLERRNRLAPGPLARSWIVTPQLERILGFRPDSIIHRTGTMRMHAAGHTRDVKLRDADFIVEREQMIQILRERALAAGVTIRWDARVTDVRAIDRGVRVTIAGKSGLAAADETLTAPILIGADGAHSTVADAFGAPPLPTVPVLQARVALPAGASPDVSEVWFKPDRTRYFFWSIPENSRTAVVGLIADGPGDARSQLDRFLREGGYEPMGFQGALIPLHKPMRRVEWRGDGWRVLLIGDAAGHVKITTVGGLVSGLWGANAAADAIIARSSYRAALKPLQRELVLHDVIRWGLHRFSEREYGELLRALSPSLLEVLATENRDSAYRARWRLLGAQPGLLARAARAIFFPMSATNGAVRSFPLAAEAGD
jgi:flavin-dependent dehydrogenase